MLSQMRFIDKMVLSVLLLILIVRAPFIILPLLIIIYMFYVISRSVKREMDLQTEKTKKKEMRNRISALESQIQHLNSVLAESQRDSTDDINKSS